MRIGLPPGPNSVSGPIPSHISGLKDRQTGASVVQPAGNRDGNAAGAGENALKPVGSGDADGQVKARSASYGGLSEAEQRVVRELKAADRAVRSHEMAHVAAGGQYVRSGARFRYQRGPDGQNYAVAGEVGIDISPVPGDPEATMAKMETVQRAALAPMDPSAQDRRIAAKAAQMRAEAAMDLAVQSARARLGPVDTAADAWKQKETGGYAQEGAAEDTGMTVGSTVNTFG